MPAIFHSKPVFARVLPTGGKGHGAVHTAQKFIGGPKPTKAFCGFALDGSVRIVGSPFDGIGDVTCDACDAAVVRIADFID